MSLSNDSVVRTDNNSSSLDCNFSWYVTYDTVVAAICVVICLFGLVYTFVGYRCFKAVMFLSGLIFGGTIVFVLCHEERILQHALSFEATVGIAIGIGVLCGFITMLVRYVGLFLQGFFLGLLIAIAAIVALQKFYHPATPWIPVGILFGTGILFSLLTLKWQKAFIIVSTSVMGAALICTCLEYFMEKFLLLRYIWEALMASSSIAVCWYTWVIFGIWPILSVFGCIVQWKFTGKGYDHTDVIIWRSQRKRVRTHLVRQNYRHDRNHPVGTSTCVSSEPLRSQPNSMLRTRNANLASNQSMQAQPGNNASSRGANYDALPPSYDDCVVRGVGDPVREEERSRIVRTKHGSFIAPSGQRYTSDNLQSQNPQLNVMQVNSTRITRNVSDRRQNLGSSQRGRGRRQRHQAAESGQRNQPSLSNRQSSRLNNESPVVESAGVARNRSGNRNNPHGRSKASAIDDRQSLLSTDVSGQQSSAVPSRQPRSSEAIVAHARRIRAAQERRGNDI